MPEIYTRVHNLKPRGMPGDSFARLIKIATIILVLLAVSLLMQGTGSIVSTAIRLLMLVPIILISLSFHEFSHALMADFLGDPTPRRMGRLSLNPLRHLDIMGTLMLFFAGFGWAKPVRVDPRYFKIPQRAMLSVALAGPASNILLAVIGAILMKILSSSLGYFSSTFWVLLAHTALQTFIIINLSLAVFNLLPLPPLDGSRIVAYLLPQRYMLQYRQFEQMAPIILLLLFIGGGLSLILSPAISYMFNSLMSLVGNPQRAIQLFLMRGSGGIQL